jgi:SAM-dependent methyltransferase
LFEFQFLDQLAGGEFALAQGLDDGDAGGVGESLKDSGLELAEFLCHYTLVYSIIRMSEPNRTRARELAAESRLSGDPTGWFEQLYQEHEQGQKVVPWADLKVNPDLLEFDGSGKTALVVGCGFGDDAEQLAAWGFETTAFDVSLSAIRACTTRFPDSSVRYVAGDVLVPPVEWTGGFDFVLEIYTLQVLPAELRGRAIRSLTSFLKKGGMVLLIARGREETDPEGSMPWPLMRRELDEFAAAGLREKSFEDYFDKESPPVRRFRAIYVK